MTKRPETRAQVERVRRLYHDAESRCEYLTLEDIGRALGVTKQWASRLLMAAGLAPMLRPKGEPRAKGATVSRQESGARGGRARTPAKLAAVTANLRAWRATASPEEVRANLAKARAAKPSAAEIALMNPVELAERATLAMFQGRPHGVLRWLRQIELKGVTLTDKQREAKERAERECLTPEVAARMRQRDAARRARPERLAARVARRSARAEKLRLQIAKLESRLAEIERKIPSETT